MASTTTPPNETETQETLTTTPATSGSLSTQAKRAPRRSTSRSAGRWLFGLVVLLVLAGLLGLALWSTTSGPVTVATNQATATPAITSSPTVSANPTSSAVSPISWNVKPVLYQLTVSPTSSDFQSLWAGMEDGLRHSADGGKTWTTVDDFKNQTVTAIAFDRDDSQHAAYVGTAQAGLFKSTDAGKTWRNIGLVGRPITGLAVDKNTLYVGVNGPRPSIYHSADGGQTFATPNTNQLPPDLDLQTMSIDTSNPLNIYIGTAYTEGSIAPDWDRIKYSNDGGKTWQRVGPALVPDSTDGSPDARQPITVVMLASGVGALYAGNGDLLWQLSPDRNSWQPVQNGLPTDGVYGLTTDPQLPGLLYAATRDGFYRNSDGQSWQKLATGSSSPIFGTTAITSTSAVTNTSTLTNTAVITNTNTNGTGVEQTQLTVMPALLAATTATPANSNRGLHTTLLYGLSAEGQLVSYENRDFDPELVASTGASNLPDFTSFGGVNPAEPLTAPLDGAPTDPNKIFVKESGHYIQGDFKDIWTDPSKNAAFFYGNPLTEQFQEYDYSSKITKTVQFFQNVKFESTKAGQVNLAPVGREAIEGQFFPPGRFLATNSSQQYFDETKHTLRGGFFQFWQTNGGLARFGFPITEEFTEKDASGKDIVYQYFERVKLAFDPETTKVTIATLGLEVLQKRGWLPKS